MHHIKAMHPPIIANLDLDTRPRAELLDVKKKRVQGNRLEGFPRTKRDSPASNLDLLSLAVHAVSLRRFDAAVRGWQ